MKNSNFNNAVKYLYRSLNESLRSIITKTYHVYKCNELDDSYKAISSGWKWGAFWFGMFWFLYKKAYRTAGMFFLGVAAMVILDEYSQVKSNVASIALAVVAGMNGAEYVEKEYKRKYLYCGDVEAKNGKEAIEKQVLLHN